MERVFFDSEIVDYLYQILRDGVPAHSLTVPVDEQRAILAIWQKETVVTTSAVYQEVQKGFAQQLDDVRQKIGEKMVILDHAERVGSTSLYYGEGRYSEGRYGMPPVYQRLLGLFKSSGSRSETRDAQHILNCYDNSLRYLVTLDKELLRIGKCWEVTTLGVEVVRPSEFVTKVYGPK